MDEKQIILHNNVYSVLSMRLLLFLLLLFCNNLRTSNQQMASLTFHFVFVLTTDSTFYFISPFHNKNS